MSDIELVGIGAMNVDHLYEVEQILSDGQPPVTQDLVGEGASSGRYQRY